MLRPELAQAGGFQKNLVVGNRIPRDYFVTTGSGESDITVHAGSYHLALKSAGIEMANIMTYSSILPGIANEIPKPISCYPRGRCGVNYGCCEWYKG